MKNLPAEEIGRRYQAGETASDLAREYGTNYQVIQRRLRKLGIPWRGKEWGASGRAAIADLRRVEIDEDRLRDLASQNLSTREIAAHFCVSEEAVRDRMIHHGLARLAAKARPEKNHFWSGGLTVDKDGYILVKSPSHPQRSKSGYVREHRLVVESSLGRLLLPTEVVDHCNGDTSDNRLENLRLFASNGEHLRATRTGRRKLSTEEREWLRQAAVQRAKSRVAARIQVSETDADQ